MQVQKARRGRPARKAPSILEAEMTGATPSATNYEFTPAETAPAPAHVAPHTERPSMRPAMRDEDPRAAAARRAAEIRGHIGNLDEGTDEFAAPLPPDGWTYEWKAKTVMGAEDPARQVQYARTGWEPVPTYRHPDMMPHNAAHPVIERKGMVLMQRPKDITEEMKDIDLRRARNQVQAKKQQLSQAPDGQFERRSNDVKIRSSYEPIPVPTE